MDYGRTDDRISVSAGYRAGCEDGAVLRGHLLVTRADGEVLIDHHNMIVDAGLNAIVDSFVTGTPALNGFKYVGFGTSNAETTAAMTELTAEVSGGTYARLTGTQAEGDTTKEYRVSGTWTNSSGASQSVNEYGLFSASTDGTMLARVSSGDAGGPAEKTVANGETITVTWDIAWADA
jgi:hypothetical protein